MLLHRGVTERDLPVHQVPWLMLPQDQKDHAPEETGGPSGVISRKELTGHE